MKLRNKKTGQVENFCIDKDQICSCNRAFVYDSLTQLQEAGWEDYEEPKKNVWYLNSLGSTIENYFETEEEAEKAVEKLKAWKRLRDKGFKFTGFTHKDRGRMDELEIYCQLGERPENIEDMDDVHLLFGGEE